MRKIIGIIACPLLLLSIYGCGHSNSEIIKLVEERDSLKLANQVQSKELSNYGKMIQVINSTLDSIAMQENLIFVSNDETPLTKESVEYNLMRFETILNRQKEKIDQLEKQLKEQETDDGSSFGLIAHLREQIEVKDKQIAQLRGELAKKNVDIARLQEQVESQRVIIDTQQVTINELDKRNKRQTEALARQDAILNNGYVLIGTKEDLKRKGVITKKGVLVSDAVLDRTKFAKVDIREWREVTFTAKRPRILTNMPSTSYELTTMGNGTFTLIVSNPTDFWGISMYLVIQTD